MVTQTIGNITRSTVRRIQGLGIIRREAEYPLATSIRNQQVARIIDSDVRYAFEVIGLVGEARTKAGQAAALTIHHQDAVLCGDAQIDEISFGIERDLRWYAFPLARNGVFETAQEISSERKD